MRRRGRGRPVVIVGRDRKAMAAFFSKSGRARFPGLSAFRLLMLRHLLGRCAVPLAGILVMLATAPPAVSQAPVVLSGVECPSCEVRLSHLVTVGAFDGPVETGQVISVSLLEDGRYALSSQGSENLISVFAADGRFLMRTGGRGVFGYVRFLRTHGNSLHVIDPMMRRHTVLSPEFTVVRTARLSVEPLGDVLPVSDSSLVMSGFVRAAEGPAHLLHVVGPAGGIQQAMAEEPEGVRMDRSPEVYMRALAPGRGSELFWAAHRTRYRVEEWGVDGVLRRVLVREVPWFPDHRGADDRGPDEQPLPRIVDVQVDSDDRMWVLIRHGSEEWDELMGSRPQEDREFVMSNLDRLYTTVIEVIDLRSHAVLASSTVDAFLFSFVGDGRVASASSSDGVATTVNIWDLSILTR